jgi:glutathione peroxidase-family protein
MEFPQYLIGRDGKILGSYTSKITPKTATW